MIAQEILKGLNALLDSHAKLGGSIYQVGYKDDFFRLFIEAYRNKRNKTRRRCLLVNLPRPGQAGKEVQDG